jgi:hypothetical protein
MTERHCCQCLNKRFVYGYPGGDACAVDGVDYLNFDKCEAFEMDEEQRRAYARNEETLRGNQMEIAL